MGLHIERPADISFQSNVVKAIWAIVVFLSFAGAGFLISNSYSKWQESPVTTTVSTHPIAELRFPTVTVCPPKGSRTALNHDLMKAGNMSLTKQNRKDLHQAVHDILTYPAHLDHIKNVMELINPELVRQGYQTIPRPYAGNSGMEVKSQQLVGTLQTPWFNKTFDESYYQENRHHHLIIQFPYDLLDHIGSGSLVIQIKVDIREDTGWQEQVKYSEGFKLFQKERRSWKDAESFCQERGGHLASILSEEEHEEVRSKAGTTILWIGGSYREEEAGFGWTDGSPWGYTRWGNGYGKTGEGKDCLYIRGKDWRESTCRTTRNFICNSNRHIVRERKRLTLKYIRNFLGSL